MQNRRSLVRRGALYVCIHSYIHDEMKVKHRYIVLVYSKREEERERETRVRAINKISRKHMNRIHAVIYSQELIHTTNHFDDDNLHQQWLTKKRPHQAPCERARALALIRATVMFFKKPINSFEESKLILLICSKCMCTIYISLCWHSSGVYLCTPISVYTQNAIKCNYDSMQIPFFSFFRILSRYLYIECTPDLFILFLFLFISLLLAKKGLSRESIGCK